jgi:hypothetical protein
MLVVDETLPKGRRFNHDCFISSILPWLMKAKQRFTRKNQGTAFLLHMDNSACHYDFGTAYQEDIRNMAADDCLTKPVIVTLD